MRRRMWQMRAWQLALTACGMLMMASVIAFGQDKPVVLEPDSDGVQRTTIMLDSYAFTPNHVSVQSGAPVELLLENRSVFTPHNFIIDSAVPDLQQNVNVGAGERVMLRFLPEVPGTYLLYCDEQLLFFPSHREEGMEGHLEVR